MLIFRIIVCILGLIGLFTGANDLWKGAAVKGDFGELGPMTDDPTLNFTLRFLGAIWMGFGGLLILFASNLERYKVALLVSFIIVIIGGLGRLFSVIRLGITKGNETMVYSILSVELLLVPVLLGWLLFRFNSL